MSTRKIRNSWWVDFRAEGVRYRKRSPDNTQAGAKAYEALLRGRLARGEPMDGRGDTPLALPRFDKFAAEWMQTWVRANNKPATVQNKGTMLRAHLLPWFGQLPLDRVDAQAIERFKAESLAKGCSPQTVNGALTTLSSCLRRAVEWGLLGAAPRVRWLRAPRMPVPFLSLDESRRLVETAEPGRWRDMVLTALHTGIRFGELAALHWGDVDLTARRLTVRRNLSLGTFTSPKNYRARHLPLTETLCEALARRSTKSGLLFPSQAGRPVLNSTASDALHRIARRAGLPRIGWHTLRHTFASHLVAAGVPLPAVQQLLGHATIAMTMRYAHLAPSTLREAVAVLDCSRRTEALGQPVGNAADAPALRFPALRLPGPEFGAQLCGGPQGFR